MLRSPCLPRSPRLPSSASCEALFCPPCPMSLNFAMAPAACLPAEAYEPEYEHSVMYCQEYRPSDLRLADNGARGSRPAADAWQPDAMA